MGDQARIDCILPPGLRAQGLHLTEREGGVFLREIIEVIGGRLFNIDSIAISTSIWRVPTLPQATPARAETRLIPVQDTPNTSDTAVSASDPWRIILSPQDGFPL